MRSLPPGPAARRNGGSPAPRGSVGRLAAEALAQPRSVLRLPPAADLTEVALAAAARGPALVLCATGPQVRRVAAGLRRAGVVVARHPRDWAAGAAGATVVGTRAAAWAPWAGSPPSWCSTSTTRPTSRRRRPPGTRGTSPPSGPGGPASRAC